MNDTIKEKLNQYLMSLYIDDICWDTNTHNFICDLLDEKQKRRFCVHVVYCGDRVRFHKNTSFGDMKYICSA